MTRTEKLRRELNKEIRKRKKAEKMVESMKALMIERSDEHAREFQGLTENITTLEARLEEVRALNKILARPAEHTPVLLGDGADQPGDARKEAET